MGYRIKLSFAAQQDIDEAVSWYENQQKGLRNRLLDALDSYFDLLVQHPEMFPVEFEYIRKAVIAKFPYMIFYSVDGNNKYIIILAVWHASRDRKFLANRTR